VRVDDFDVASPDDLRTHVASFEDEQTVTVTLQRDGEDQSVKLTLGDLPIVIPAQLPKASDLEPAEQERQTEVIDIKLPEEAGSCVALIPGTYDPRVTHGLLVEIARPGEFSKEQFKEEWSGLAEAHGIIVLAPQPKDDKRWLPTETEFIRKTIDAVKDSYEIDANRVVLYGYRSGGSMAFLTAFRHRESVRGIATVDTAISLGRGVPEPDPANRLSIYAALAADTKNLDEAESTLDLLKKQRFPVTQVELGKTARPLDQNERAELCRWVDSLDQI
jgi:hypothetical protein